MNRIQVLVVVALFSIAIASCTTSQTALFPPLPPIEAHVISGQVAPKRSLASTTDESILEAEFQQIMSSDDVDKVAHKQVDRIARIFYRTQAFLNDYDAKIDEVSKQENPPENALQTDDAYARLIAAWGLREETLEKISYFYKRALETEMNRAGDTPVARSLQDRAMLMNRAIRNAALSASNSTNRLAKQDLLRELIRVNQDFRESLNTVTADGPTNKDLGQETNGAIAVLSEQLINNPKDMQSFYERNQRQLERETESSIKDAELTQEMERLVPDAKRHLAEQFEQRTPQSVGAVAPGLGRSGMMNGFEFSPGTWALTFDDGPHARYTPQALANLKASGMKATFFWLANNVSRMRSIVAQAKEVGMTLANHSYTHANLPKLGPAGLKHEIEDSTAVDVAAGFHPRFFRCPYGACGSQTSVVRQKIADLKMVSVTWNVDSLDWQDKNPASVYARVKKQMAVQKRGIILFHDIHPQSIAASKMVMDDLAAGQKKGTYRTVTIDQAFDELNKP
jgi:peptidoglycan/xylan/chitin deacetylase (PgdA/CDA1 family)